MLMKQSASVFTGCFHQQELTDPSETGGGDIADSKGVSAR